MISRDDESLRVLMISPQFRPLVGGYERAAERLSAALAEVGLRVVVIAERRDRAWPAMECIDGYEVRRLSCSYRRHRHAVTSLLSFAGFLLRHGREFDVWHVHQYGFHAALAVALGKVLRRPVVLKLTSSGAMGIESAMGGRHCRAHSAFFSFAGKCLPRSQRRDPRGSDPFRHSALSTSTSSPTAWMAASFTQPCRKSALPRAARWGWIANGWCSMSAASRRKRTHWAARGLGGHRYRGARGRATGTGW